MGKIIAPTRAGDEQISWDPADDVSVAEAQQAFDNLKDEGYTFYTEAGNRLDVFEPSVGNVNAVPPMAGG